jgi:two-component system chemotaxis response regulator CheB
MAKIRVLIVDDSVTQREIFRRLLADDPELVVVAEARNGIEALSQVQAHAPDVVLMDIHMPEMDGISATEEIMKRFPVPIVIASATLKKRDVDLAMKALEAGAVAVIEKPEGAVLLHLGKMAPELRRELIAAANARLPRVRRPSSPVLDTRLSPDERGVPTARTSSVVVIGICASTGGPVVLLEILSHLPKPFPIPILLVQHISANFEEGFARWLSQTSGQTVAIAKQRERLGAGVWMSPAGRHLTVGSPTHVELRPGDPSEIHCPSGNRLFESLALHFGPRALGIQLTGMGDDGASGLLSLKQSGGMTVIQSEASCLIWGMPKVARQMGAATQEWDPPQIIQALTSLAISHRSSATKT